MVEILDSTLREGEQTPYVNFLIDEKIEIAHLLDKTGVDMIEAGDPSVSPNVYKAVKKIASLRLHAEIVAHSLATKSGVDKAKECKVGRVAIFYPTSQIHLESKMHKSQDQIFTAIIFSRYLTDGGYYIIEDVQESARFEVFKVIQDALYPKFQVSQTEMKNGSGDDSRLVVIRKK